LRVHPDEMSGVARDRLASSEFAVVFVDDEAVDSVFLQ
jgi:hypothetical protein